MSAVCSIEGFSKEIFADDNSYEEYKKLAISFTYYRSYALFTDDYIKYSDDKIIIVAKTPVSRETVETIAKLPNSTFREICAIFKINLDVDEIEKFHSRFAGRIKYLIVLDSVERLRGIPPEELTVGVLNPNGGDLRNHLGHNYGCLYLLNGVNNEIPFEFIPKAMKEYEIIDNFNYFALNFVKVLPAAINRIIYWYVLENTIWSRSQD